MPSLSSTYNRGISTANCRENLSAGSCFLVASVPNCGQEPILYTITNTAAAAISTTPTTLTLSVTGATQDGVAVTPTPTSVLIRANSLLTFGAVTVLVTDEVTITTATAVNVASVPAAIAAAATSQTWALQLLETATDIPLDITSAEESNKRLKDGLQSSSAKTSVSLNVNLAYYSAADDFVQDSIMLKASLSSENFFAFIVKSSGKAGWGLFKLLGLQESGGLDEIIKYTANLSFQAPWSVAARRSSTLVNTPGQLAALNLALRYAGVAEVV
jgi:hypothetical protein